MYQDGEGDGMERRSDDRDNPVRFDRIEEHNHSRTLVLKSCDSGSRHYSKVALSPNL